MKRTSLYEEHLTLGARMVEFGGWEMPLNYDSGILVEHLTTRRFGGLFDVSHMGRFRISGRDALPFMQHVLTNNAAALESGQSQYTIISNGSGGAVDDSYLYRLEEEEYLLVVNAANTEKDWLWLEKHGRKFPQLILEDQTSKIAMLSLQGPRTKAVLEAIVGGIGKIIEPVRNRLVTIDIFGNKVAIARTGYTGEPIGFELFPPSDIVVRLYKKLLERGKESGVMPAGLGARDTLRLEAGLPLYGNELGNDLEGKEIPIFALPAARRAVSFSKTKGDFVGYQALMKQFQEIRLREEGLLNASKKVLLVPKAIMPIAIVGGGIARPGCPIYIHGNLIGNVTSGTMVPYWKTRGVSVKAEPGNQDDRRAICLAYLDADLREGQRLKVVIRDKTSEAIIVKRHIGSEAAPYARPLLVEEVGKTVVARPKESMESLAKGLVTQTRDNTIWRQRNVVNLIPSEQTPSPLVRLLTIADPEGRYAEHRRIEALGTDEVYYYQGTEFIAKVERELIDGMKEFLGCANVDLRPISGQMANVTVFSGLVDYLNRVDRRAEPRRLKKVMNHHIGRGGHLSAQPMGALRDYASIDPVTERWSVVNFPISQDNPYTIDLAETAALIQEHKPELIIFGKSVVLHPEPIQDVAEMVSDMKPRPIIMYDAAHVLGLIGPEFEEPLSEGADIITGSTHKTFFGTQRGMIASNMSEGTYYDKLWEMITRRAFPGSVSNHHLGTMLGLLMATYEMNNYGVDYQKQVMANAKSFASALKTRGLAVEGDPAVKYTQTHQVILRVGYSKGIEVADRLEESNIVVNYQALPDDEGFSASSGLRMGVQEMTRFGMKEEDFEELAEYVADVVLRGKNLAQQISNFRHRFTKMQYCLPGEQATPLINELIESLTKL